MSTELTAVVVSVAFWVTMVVLMLFRELQHDREIRQRTKFEADLLNRLMAKDWGEYRMTLAGPIRDVPPLSDEQEARLAEQWASEIKAQEQVLGEERNQGIDLGFN